mgnify:CR=1 FL=1
MTSFQIIRPSDVMSAPPAEPVRLEPTRKRIDRISPFGPYLLSPDLATTINVALALDLVAMASAELANISERRIEQMVNPDISGLPPFLANLGDVEGRRWNGNSFPDGPSKTPRQRASSSTLFCK